MKLLYVFVLLGICACAGTGVKRVVIDESANEPSWVSDERISWEDDGKIFFKAHQTVRGDQRLNGCYTIASHDNRETLIRKQVESMSGQTNEAQADISENAELVLGKVRSGEWSGKLYGFSDTGYYFQRVQIRDEMAKSVTERIDCYTLSSISTADYEKSRAEILNKITHIDKKIKDAINQREADFFKKDETKAEPTTMEEAPVKSEPITQSVPEVKPASVPAKLPEQAKVPEPVVNAPKVAAPAVEAPAAPVAQAQAPTPAPATPAPAVEPAKEVAKETVKGKATEPATGEATKSLASAVK